MMPNDYWHRPIAEFLRNRPKNHARSAYAFEVNPWTTRGDVEAAQFFRGTIVSGFGYIDTRLSELAIRISKMPEYRDLRSTFPYSFGKRVHYLPEVFSKPPLEEFGGLALQFLARLESHYELRNLAAHGKMQVMPDWGVTFTDYPATKGDKITQRRERFTPAMLEAAAYKVARFSRLSQLLLVWLERSVELPPIE